MSASRKKRIDSSERACLECQRRKTRCIILEGGQICSYCQKTGRSCIFGEPTPRTPLTRKNLDAAEARCRRLEVMIQNLRAPSNGRPVADIDHTDHNDNTDHQDILGLVQNDVDPIAHTDLQHQNSGHQEFEWQETFAGTSRDRTPPGDRDGMAVFPPSTRNAGYLGDTSGSNILRSMSSLLPEPAYLESLANPRSQLVTSEPMVPAFITNQHLSTSYVHNQLIGAYFVAFNCCYPIIHEASFRKQYAQRSRIPTHSSWHIIHHMILAIGEWVYGSCDEQNSMYYEAARSRLRVEVLESGSTTLVQAFLLLGNYLQKRDRPNTAYNYIGIAYRMALGLGLHREVTSKRGRSDFALQSRRLLFWTLYCFESGFSITTGRPTLVADTFIDAQKPLNVDDSHCDASTKLVKEVTYPTSCSAIVAQARLAVIANRLHAEFLCTPCRQNISHQTAILEHALDNWRQSLPAFFFSADVPQWFLGPRRVILWKEANLRILLLLAAQRHHTDEHEKMATGVRCEAVAIGTLVDITDFCTMHNELAHVGLSWYAIYFLLQAALAVGVHRLRCQKTSTPEQGFGDPARNSTTWEAALEKTHACLQVMGQTNRSAIRTLRVLEQMAKALQQQTTDLGKGQSLRSSSLSASETPTQMNTPHVFTRSSPNDVIATNFVNNDWVNSADPSLHMFLDSTQMVDDIFENLEGFPGNLDNFAYTTSSMQTMRGYGPENAHIDSDIFAFDALGP